MDFQIYKSFESFEKYKDAWNELLSHSASHVPFLTFEYQQAWWQTCGGGEWPQSSQLILIAAFRDQELTGIAPFFYTRNPMGKPALMLVGAVDVSDFLDFIVQPKDLPNFVNGLLDFLMGADLPPWELLDLHNLLGESPTLEVLKTEAKMHNWQYQQTHLQPSPYIPLPRDFEAYLAQIGKKQRHEIRRKQRNVSQSLLEGGLYFTQEQEKLESDIEVFLDMMAQDPFKRDFLTEKMRQHIKNTARIAFNEGWLQLAFFTLNSQKAAANMTFNYNNKLWLYNSGWEWQYRDYSPGWVLLAHLIKWAIENGIQEFDFMRGDEPYKYKFGGIDRHVYRMTLTPNELLGTR